MTDEVTFRSDMGVKLVSAMASDQSVADAARISTGLDKDDMTHAHKAGLISYLMRNRHGTPFEHNSFTFRVECPLFVAREFMRHRIASYNETSGRYRELEPVFWIPESSRPLVQVGKPGSYDMHPGDVAQYVFAHDTIKESCRCAYKLYREMLEEGICREVARACLPLSLYTSFYVTLNARSLMNFLSLRVDDPDNTFTTKPQYEIQQVALAMQDEFSRRMPLTFRAFEENGRVAP